MDNIKTFLIFALIGVSLLLWNAWQTDYVTPEVAPTVETDLPMATSDSLPTAAPATAAGDLPNVPVLENVPTAAASSTSTGRWVRVTTDVLDVFINTEGGDIQRLKLTAYPIKSTAPNVPFDLMGKTDMFFVSQTGLIGQEKGSAPTHYDTFSAQQDEYTLAAGADEILVPLTWRSAAGVTVTKTYTFKRDSYQVGLAYEIKNGGTDAFTAYPYAQFNRTPPEDTEGFIYTYTGAVFSSDENKYEKVDFGDLEDGDFKRANKGGWAAMIQHYFVAAWLPENKEQSVNFYGKSLANNHYLAGMKLPVMTVAAGATEQSKWRMYAGPKEHKRLEAAADNLDLSVDYGMFTIISKPLFWLLEWFHKLTGNWGWAIVLLTVTIKGAFFKLSAKSYRSMAAMRKLTPKLAVLKERHGENKQEYSKAMMELYRTEKINPLSGCWPVLLQMPVFLSLYWVLVESVEIRQAPFVLWLQDLTAMDPYFVLPVIFGLSMFFQQKLNPPPQDPAQAMMMKAFPPIFTIFFAFFPSGLVLYWVVNNLLSIAQQWYITRKLGAL